MFLWNEFLWKAAADTKSAYRQQIYAFRRNHLTSEEIPNWRSVVRLPKQKVVMSAFDESSFYEIVELENGDVALRRAEYEDEEPLVTIRFSSESNDYLGAARFEVAKFMIEAGLDIVAELEEGEDPMSLTAENNLLH